MTYIAVSRRFRIADRRPRRRSRTHGPMTRNEFDYAWESRERHRRRVRAYDWSDSCSISGRITLDWLSAQVGSGKSATWVISTMAIRQGDRGLRPGSAPVRHAAPRCPRRNDARRCRSLPARRSTCADRYGAGCPRTTGARSRGSTRLPAAPRQLLAAAIAGLHHAAGFCVFNDCGVAAELPAQGVRSAARRLCRYRCASRRRRVLRLRGRPRPDLCGHPRRWPLPVSGHRRRRETGTGRSAKGTKLNIPMLPWRPAMPTSCEAWAGSKLLDAALEKGVHPVAVWRRQPRRRSDHAPLRSSRAPGARPRCGSSVPPRRQALASPAVSSAPGGGGYNRHNLARAWTAFVRSFVETGGSKMPVALSR